MRLATDYLPNVRLVVAERDGRIVGFAGVASGKLEMLFVDADHRGAASEVRCCQKFSTLTRSAT